MSIFTGLFGYEIVMLICGCALFVFTLIAITVMLVQRRSFKTLLVLLPISLALMGFPGIQSFKFGHDTVEIDRARKESTAAIGPAQTQRIEKALVNVQQRSSGQPLLRAKVADGYRALGQVNKAYALAQAVLAQAPSAAARATLVPVLTAKLDQVQADTAIALPRPAAPASLAPVTTPPAPSPSAAPVEEEAASAAAPAASAAYPAGPAPTHEIAVIASQLQATGVPLPAQSHATLAKAYVVLGQPAKAQANVEAARRIDPTIHINSSVLRALKRNRPPPPSSKEP